MAQKCQGCRITENYKYWSELPAKNYQFFTVMPHDFQQRLQIPKKFTECFKHKLEPWCTLMGASQNKWKVKLATTSTEHHDEGSSSLAFLEGWKQYVSDNGVEFGDFLVFRYAGDSSFEVRVFDKSGCEREGTHFATNASSSSTRTTCYSILHHHHLNNSANIISNNNDSDSEDSVQEVNPREEEESEEEDEVDESVDCEVGEKRGRRSGSSSNQEKNRQVQKYFVSKRRRLTKAEQLRATKLALKYVSKNQSVPSFKITFRPSHVYHGFHLSIPKMWAVKHMRNESHEVELRVPKGDGAERSWIVGCSWTVTGVRQCQLRARWSMFVLDNNLEEHDACVFELIRQGVSPRATPIFNVHIFRAVDRIVPLSVSKRLV